MECDNAQKILDILADNQSFGWIYHSDDSVHVFISHISKPKEKACRVRKDTGIIEMLNGKYFYFNGKKIGWRLSAEEFIQLIERSKR